MTDTNLVAKIILRLQDEASRGLDVARQRVGGIGQEVDRVKQLMIGFLSFAAAKNGIEDIVDLSDRFASMTGRIKQTLTATGDLAEKELQLFDISKRTNTALEGTTQLYARTYAAVKKFGDGQDTAAKLTETVNLSFKAQNSTAAEVSSTITQLTQSIATDAVQWEDFGQLADTNLMLVNIAAKNLGYDGIGSLKKAMSEGQVSNTQMVAAIIAGFDEVKAAADQMPGTVGKAWTNLKTDFLQYIGLSKDAKDANNSLADGIEFVSTHLDRLITLAVKAGEVLLVAFGATKLKGLVIYTEGLFAARAATIAAAEASATAAAAALAEAEAIATASTARAAEIIATQEVIVLARAEALAKLQATNATIVQTRATIAALEAMVQTTTTTWLLTQATASLTAAETARAAILTDLAALSASNARMNTELAAAQTIQAVATRAQGEAAAAATIPVTLFAKAIKAISWAAPLVAAAEVGVAIGEWATQFRAVKIVAAELGKAIAVTVAFVETLMHPSLENWSKFGDEVGRIKAHFDEVYTSVDKIDKAAAPTVFDRLKASANSMAEGIDAALTKAKDAAKTHADEMIKPYDDASKAIVSYFNDVTTGIDDDLKQQLNAIEDNVATEEQLMTEAANAVIDAEGKKTTAVVDGQTKRRNTITTNVGTEKETIHELTSAVVDAEGKKTTAVIDGQAKRHNTITTNVGTEKETIHELTSAVVDAEGKKTKAVVDGQTANSNAIAFRVRSEKEKIAEATQAVIDAENNKIKVVKETVARLDTAWNNTYGKAIELARKAGGDITALEKEGAEKRISSLQTVVDGYRSSIDRMIDEEHRLLQEVRKTQEERVNFLRNGEEVLRGLKQKGMTDEQAYADRELQIEEKKAAAKKALAENNFTEAKRLSDEIIRMAGAESQAIDRVTKDSNGNTQRTEAISKAKVLADSERDVADAIKLGKAALDGRQNAATSEIDNVRRNTAAMEDVYKTSFERLNKLKDDFNAKGELKISLDATAAQSEIDKLAALTAAKELTAKIKVDPINADQEIADLQAKLSAAKVTVPAVVAFDKMRDEELAKIQEELRKSIAFLTAVPVGVDTSEAVAKLETMKADIDAKLSTPTQAQHTVNPDFEAVFRDINEIKQNTFSTHTIYVNEVQQHASGGLIQHLATGGRVAAQTFRRVVGAITGPGTGTSDDVPVMASNGEYVIKADAVQHYGVNFFNNLNNKQLPVAPGYAIGGQVGAASSASSVSATPVVDTVNLNFNFSDRTVSLQAPRNDARELAVQLRRLASVS